MRNRTDRKDNNLIILVMLVVFTQIIVISTAKYISVTYNNDTVEIASFIVNTDVSESVKQFELTDLYPGCADKVLRFSVSNSTEDNVSEVTNGYSFIIESMGNIPLNFNIEVDEERTTQNGTTASQYSKNKSNYWTGGILPKAISTTHYYKITVSWDESSNDAEYSQEIDMIEVKVMLEQID